MKLFVKCVMLSLFLTLFPVGCSSQLQVQLDSLFPSKVALPKYGAFEVVSKSHGKTAKALQRAFAQDLERVYKLSATEGAGNLYLVIDRVIVRCDEVGATQAPDDETLNSRHERRMQNIYPCSVRCELKARVSLVEAGQVLWCRSHCVEVFVPPLTHMSATALCEKFVADLMPYLAPHRETYSVKVNLNGASAELMQAVQALHLKDYATALDRARLAHSKNPQDPEPIYIIGLLARYYGDYPASTALFKKAYALKEDERFIDAQQQNLELYGAEFEARVQSAPKR